MKKSPIIKKAGGTKTESNFLDTVYAIVRKIPRGRATSYGAIAESAGIRLSARMVGWAMHGADRVDPPIAAHRVVNSKGLLTGKHHFATPTLMQELLENEGIRVENNQIQDFRTIFWDPANPEGKAPAVKKAATKKVSIKAPAAKKATKETAGKKAAAKATVAKKATATKKAVTSGKATAPGKAAPKKAAAKKATTQKATPKHSTAKKKK